MIRFFFILLFANTLTNNCKLHETGLETIIALNKNEYSVGEEIKLTFTVLNNMQMDTSICIYQTPFEGHKGNFFIVTEKESGEEVIYAGPMVKRGAPTSSDYIKIASDSSKNCEVILTKTYKLQKKGEYTVRFIGKTLNGLPDSNSLNIAIK